jgi:hypothetical protein
MNLIIINNYKIYKYNLLKDNIKINISKHECPSGLRGATQVRMAKASWVQIPLHALLKLIKYDYYNHYRLI